MVRRAPMVDHKPYGSVLFGNEPSDGSWHVDAQGPLPRYAGGDTEQPAAAYPEHDGVRLIPFCIRASVLMDDVTDEMGPVRSCP